MAKTLIGNIKGKDGRGITSINKTGTTGPVDTYTITYTDSTTSTFTVNNSDSIALQRQIVPSAAVESSATASQAYAAGDYVVVNGILRKVKSSIAKGNAISDSNSTATTVTRELATLGDSVSNPGWTVLNGSIDDNHLAYKICNGICYVSIDSGGSWGVDVGANSEAVVNYMPDEALPSAHTASSACYPKGAISGVLGVKISRSSKKLTVFNSSGNSERYWSVSFCYPV